MNSRTNLGYRTEDLLRRVVNEYVIQDKTFRMSAPTTLETIKYVFGNSLSEGQLRKMSGHDGYVALYVDDVVRGEYENVPKPAAARDRRDYAARSKPVIDLLSGIFGSKPLLEVQQGIDINPNIFGARSTYLCCVWGIDETGFANFVKE